MRPKYLTMLTAPATLVRIHYQQPEAMFIIKHANIFHPPQIQRKQTRAALTTSCALSKLRQFDFASANTPGGISEKFLRYLATLAKPLTGNTAIPNYLTKKPRRKCGKRSSSPTLLEYSLSTQTRSTVLVIESKFECQSCLHFCKRMKRQRMQQKVSLRHSVRCVILFQIVKDFFREDCLF